MNYASIRKMDIANGEGVRVSLFVSGCNFHCKNCFNTEAQSFEYGHEYTQDTEERILSLVSKPYVAGLSILGGDPLWQSEEDIKLYLIPLVEKTKSLNKTVWLWSGFTWEEVNHNPISSSLITRRKHLVKKCDVFVDGRYKDDLRDLNLKWRGSSNQRVIDVQETLKSNEVVLYCE